MSQSLGLALRPRIGPPGYIEDAEERERLSLSSHSKGVSLQRGVPGIFIQLPIRTASQHPQPSGKGGAEESGEEGYAKPKSNNNKQRSVEDGGLVDNEIEEHAAQPENKCRRSRRSKRGGKGVRKAVARSIARQAEADRKVVHAGGMIEE